MITYSNISQDGINHEAIEKYVKVLKYKNDVSKEDNIYLNGLYQEKINQWWESSISVRKKRELENKDEIIITNNRRKF